MIGKLTGVVDSIDESSVLLDVNGVGYIAFCSNETTQNLPRNGEIVSLYIETHVREDHIHLYGFSSIAEKQAFLLLLKVSGVGAKMALAVLSVLPPEKLHGVLAAQDIAAFKPVSGVGPKLANRIVTELKDKYGILAGGDNFIANSNNINSINKASESVSGDNISDAIAALTSLGYARTDAYQMVNKIAADKGNLELDYLIRESLKL